VIISDILYGNLLYGANSKTLEKKLQKLSESPELLIYIEGNKYINDLYQAARINAEELIAMLSS